MIAIGAITKKHIYVQVLFELKEILFAFPENAPECVDVNMKGSASGTQAMYVHMSHS